LAITTLNDARLVARAPDAYPDPGGAVVTLFELLVNAAMRGAFRVACRLDIKALSDLPPQGPAILMTNHTTNLDGPAIYVFIQPRKATAIAKRELWANPITRFFMQIWKIIPINRGRVDKRALKRCVAALDQGMFLGVAPEGTRSRSGILGQGHPGIAMLATTRRVPVYPVVHVGLNEVFRSLRRLRRSRVTVRVGRPFLVRPIEGRPSTSQLRRIASEIMFQMALLLPPHLRGNYRDLGVMTTDYLTFVDE
jgi:1-acyl-sn-glycerol-3-phosphate acyltransferase